jgi:hypothetical protein
VRNPARPGPGGTKCDVGLAKPPGISPGGVPTG